MSKEKHEEQNEKGKDQLFWKRWGQLLVAFVKTKVAEIIVGFFTFLVVSSFPDKVNWLLNVLIGVLVGTLYHFHNKATFEKLEDATKEGMLKTVKDVNNLSKSVDNLSNNVIPKLEKKLSKVTNKLTKDVIETMYSFPEFISLGNEIEKSKNDCDSEIVEWVLKDQVALLEKKEHILTIEGYLKLLHKFAEEHHKLYCVNITPPVFWFSDKPNREFVEAYASETKEQRVHRLTRIDKKELLRNQFEMAFDEIGAKWSGELLRWCLFLFQRLLDDGDRQISSFVVENLSNASIKETFKMTVLESTKREKIEYGFLHDIPEEERQELLTAIRAVRDSPSHCKAINRRIVRKFIEDHKEEGSLFINNARLASAFKGLFDTKYYGEVGVYILNEEPCKAFATIGEFGSLIKIKSMPPAKVFEVLKGLFKEATEEGRGSDIGNMKYLYES
ncbi:MAG: hypothetical protein DRP65_00165 [Planctomycetota bacterium]|nr:MAG: hypothetical protein DRP65_00165 [Planctomycetota bacterium]